MATHSRILAWRIPRTEEGLVGPSPQCCKESDISEHRHTHSGPSPVPALQDTQSGFVKQVNDSG